MICPVDPWQIGIFFQSQATVFSCVERENPQGVTYNTIYSEEGEEEDKNIIRSMSVFRPRFNIVIFHRKTKRSLKTTTYIRLMRKNTKKPPPAPQG